MRICQIVPGSGGTFYCQNCLRDYTLLRALQREGQHVLLVPLYLPPFGDGAELDQTIPVFFGGINVYLQQRFPLFRRTPRWLDKLFDLPWMLKLAASQEGSTNAAQLGPMTLSMLQGRHGHQRKEFDRLVAWLMENEKPDVIHISNALLLGFAQELKRLFQVPIVCSLQDEEPWVEAMPSPWREQCWDLMASHASHVDAFVSTSHWYADRMRARMNISRSSVQVIYLGVEIDPDSPHERLTSPPTLGYLSRISEVQGFGALVDAFMALKQEPAFADLRLRATGGATPMDRPFIASIQAKLRRHGFEDSVEILPDFQKAERTEFLRSLTVFSTPVVHPEAFGIQIIEAMAQGVPVVQPAIGAYPEILAATGGGLLYDPGQPSGLVESLRSLLCDPDRARALGTQGRAAVRERFSIQRVARDMAQLYEMMNR